MSALSPEGRILVADASQVVRAIVRSQLETRGYAVTEAADGPRALAALNATEVDVVLCGVEMPGLGGYELLAAIKADPHLTDLPVVFLTGNTDSEDVAEGLRRGAHDYLRKPFEPVELAARIHGAMRTKRLEDQLRQRNAELVLLSSTDPLTGLNNRRHMQGVLHRCASLATSHDAEWGIVMVDIDRFKRINDTFGHAGGDAVLVETAARLAHCARAEDVIARWGGEEFLVALPATDGTATAIVAEALHAAVKAAPISHDGHQHKVTVSVGWASGTTTTAEGLVNAADEALYRAKDLGRDRVCGP